MSVFVATMKMNIKKELQYKTAAISGVITQIFFGFMYISLYSGILKFGSGDFSTSQMASYIWLQQIFYTMFKFYDVAKQEISAKIVSGDVSYHLIRPINLYDYWYSTIFSKSFGQMILRGIPMVIIALIIQGSWGLSLPANPESFALFLISAIIGMFLVSSINMISYFVVLCTLSPFGVFSFMNAISTFLAGKVIPIPMMPDSVQKVLNFFPFRYVADLPFRIYIGDISGTSALIQIAIQLIWFIGLTLVGKSLMNKKVNKLVVQGG